MTITPARDDFRALAQSGNVVPIFADLVADGETPTSAYQKLDDGGFSFLFESAEQTEQSGRFSFLGFHPRLVIESRNGNVTVLENGRPETRAVKDDPLRELERTMARFRFVARPELPGFAGGAVGFVGYDVASYFEPKVPVAARDDLQTPDMVFAIMQLIVIFDHRYRRVKIVANAFLDDDADAAYSTASALIAEALRQLSTPTRLDFIDATNKPAAIDPSSNISREDFERNVAIAQERIRAGDIFQAVLSQRFEADFAGSPLSLYRALRLVNPSPYMFCLQFGGEFSLIGSSPEMHARVTKQNMEVRPIAGTRRRGATAEEDEQNAAELFADEKERAEHVMLIDLARNDLGRVAEIGSVRVTEQMNVERYSHVMHLVSHVAGRLREGKTAFDVMRATFPAGTVSGAPKIRAMQIISELEKTKRGCYAGAVGYFGFDSSLDCCIALRSIVVKNNRAYVQAGAGIVADSTPAFEYRETVSKAMAMFAALGRANEISR